MEQGVQSDHPIPSSGIGSASEPLIVDEHDTGTQTRRGRKHTSYAWIYFDKPVVKDGELMAKCKGCKKFYTAKKKGGTSHLLDHGKFRCPNRHLKATMGQQNLMYGNKAGDNESELVIEPKFRQE